MDGWMDGWTDGQKYRWMDGYRNRWMEINVDGAMNEWKKG